VSLTRKAIFYQVKKTSLPSKSGTGPDPANGRNRRCIYCPEW